MTLRNYRAKRKFSRTPEPKGAPAKPAGGLRFVIQKHAARRLHFDFRLELAGTLKSWAIPKGPSLNPDDKRLAIMVEDHPLDYAGFEGIIPEGNYGAGTVMIWDRGTYHARQSTDRVESERLLLDGLSAGHLTFILHGEKLKGEFALVKLKRGEPNAWLLVKKRDEFAVSTGDGTELDRSATSGRNMAQIAEAADKTWQANKARTPVSKRKLDLRGVPEGPMPRHVKPMLAKPVTKPFDHPDWLFEIKWDGYRAIAEVETDRVRLYSRKGLSFEECYRPIIESLKQLGHEAVIDGEVVVLDQSGKAQFQLLQYYQKERKGQLVYYVFDLLHVDGHDLRELPLRRRNEILAQIIQGLPHIRLSEHIEQHGIAFFQAISERGLEGLVAKEAKSPYREGQRSSYWLKMKTHLRQEAVIAGFTAPQGGRRHFGALVLGVYEDGDLVYVGHTGGGFTDKSLADMRARLEPLIQEQCPFKKRPKTNAPAQWVQPRLVCEVSHTGWTEDGHMRTPIFVGLREDKPASEVRREKAEPVQEIIAAEPKEADPVVARSPDRATRGVVGRPRHSAGEEPIDLRTGPKNKSVAYRGRTLQLTNLNKVYWPDEGYTKADLIDYYRAVAAIIVPYLKDRPESLHRHPNGIKAKSFFQKDVSKQPPPEWVETVTLRSEEDGKLTRFLLCQDAPTLLYLANLGCIELHPWHSRTEALDQPDYMMIDLDPEDIPFDHVVEAAQAVRRVLERLGATSCCKTSGKRGLHIYVPLGRRYSHEQAKQFGELIANLAHRELPDITSVLRLPQRRQKRVYLDFLQNGNGKTLAAAYSVRPYAGATVSTPLKWSEVRRGLDPARFTIRTIVKRLKKVGDLWQPVLGPGIDLQQCLERLGNLVQRSQKQSGASEV